MKKSCVKREYIENLLDKNMPIVKKLFSRWGKYDGSVIGLGKILLIQEIKKEIEVLGVYYSGQYDILLKSLLENYEL